MSRFEDLALIEPILRAVREEGYEQPTPIQQKTIGHVLARRDVFGCAQTGTGKTAAFALPILQRLHAEPLNDPRPVRVLVLSPTRELASQIGESFTRYGRHTGVRNTVVYGGVGQQPQEVALRRGVDVLVATPGRLLDLYEQRIARLDRVEILVLDEADRMLDMGFIHDVRRVIGAVPKKRQTLFFSATLANEILSLAHDILTDPVKVEVAPAATTVDKVAQSLYCVEKREKYALLARLLKDQEMRRVLVFTRTKHGADKLAKKLNGERFHAGAIHGNKGQGAREKALGDFKRGACRILVATDIASRGIDVEEITHVVNFDLPSVPADYVHRIGRTARAGAQGEAITLCSPEEREELRGVERLIRMAIPEREMPSGFIRAVELPPGSAPVKAPRPHHQPARAHGPSAPRPHPFAAGGRFGRSGRRRRR